MRILPIITNQNMQSQKVTASPNKNYKTKLPQADVFSFGGVDQGVLARFLGGRKPSRAVLEAVDNKISFAEALKLKEKDMFRVFSPEGKFIVQGHSGFLKSNEISQKVKGNVVLFSAKNGINLDNMLRFWESGVKNIYSVNQESKKVEILEIPECTADLISLAKSLQRERFAKESKIYAVLDPYDNREQIMKSKKEIEAEYFRIFIDKLGIKVTETPYS